MNPYSIWKLKFVGIYHLHLTKNFYQDKKKFQVKKLFASKILKTLQKTI